MVEIGKSVMRFSWAITVFGAQQAADLVTGKKRETASAAFDAVSFTAEKHLGDTLTGVYRAGDEMQQQILQGKMPGLPDSAVNAIGQMVLKQPMMAAGVRASIPPLVWSLSSLYRKIPPKIAKLEAENKMWIMKLVEETGHEIEKPGKMASLLKLVEDCYAMGEFPAVWAVEGVGHAWADVVYKRGEVPKNLLTGPEGDETPSKAMTMLHAGIGLSFAERRMHKVSPNIPHEDLRRIIEGFVADCKGSSRPGYTGAAYESLGLVVRYFHGPAMCKKVGAAASDIDPRIAGWFWRGVGRSIYFSTQNMTPSSASPWPGIDLCDSEAVDEASRRAMHAGRTWATTVVNMRHPRIFATILEHYGERFLKDDSCANGVMSSVIMRHDTTPDTELVEKYRNYVPTNAKVREFWRELVAEPIERALGKYYPVLRAHDRLDEVFRYQDLGALVQELEKAPNPAGTDGSRKPRGTSPRA